MNTRHSARRITRVAVAIAGAVAVTAASVGPAAALSQDDPFGSLTPLQTHELAGLRGGFSVGSFEFNIGVVITSVNDVFSVTTTANLLPGGQITSAQTVFSQAGPQAQSQGDDPPAGDGPLVYGPGVNVPTVATTELSDGGIKVNVEGNDFVIVHEINGTDVVTFMANAGNGANLDTTVDLNISLENFSHIINNLSRNMPLILQIGHDAGVASVQ